jgi:DNA-binding MarR family transcriptional regulator
MKPERAPRTPDGLRLGLAFLRSTLMVGHTNNHRAGGAMKKFKEVLVPTTPPADGDADVGSIGNIVGFHIRLAHGAVYRHFTETFQHVDLTQKQVSVLWLVEDNAEIAQTDLAKRMRMDRATTMAIVNRLQARGYLVRGKSKTDGRKQTLSLTEAGKAALVEAKAAILEHETWLKSRFTEQEVVQLVEMLTRIHE